MYLYSILICAALFFSPPELTSAAPTQVGRERIQPRQEGTPVSGSSGDSLTPSSTPSPQKNIPGNDQFDPAHPFTPIRKAGSDYPTFDPQVLEWLRNGRKGSLGRRDRIKARQEQFASASPSSSYSSASPTPTTRKNIPGNDQFDPQNPMTPVRKSGSDYPVVDPQALDSKQQARKGIIDKASQKHPYKSHEKFKTPTQNEGSSDSNSENPTRTQNQNPNPSQSPLPYHPEHNDPSTNTTIPASGVMPETGRESEPPSESSDPLQRRGAEQVAQIVKSKQWMPFDQHYED